MSEIRSQRMEGREGEKSRKAEGQSEGEGRRGRIQQKITTKFDIKIKGKIRGHPLKGESREKTPLP